MSGTMATLLAVLIWSLHATAGDLTVQKISALQLTLESYLLGMAFLMAWTGCSRYSFLRCLKELGWRLCLFLLGSGPVLMLYYLALYGGMARAPSVDVYIIHYLWPIFAALFVKFFVGRSWGFAGVRPWILMLVAFAGAGLVVGGSQGDSGGAQTLYGYGLGVVSGLCGGLYLPALVLAGDRLTGRGYPEHIGFMFPFVLLLLSGLAVLLASIPVSPLRLTLSTESLAGVVFIGIGVVVISEMAWVWGVRWNRSQATTSLAYLTPVFSVCFLMLIAGERLTLASGVGLVLVAGANLILHLYPGTGKSYPGARSEQ